MSLFENLPKQTAYDGPPLDTVSAGTYVTCSNGHQTATLTRGYDPKKKDYYLEVKCTTRDCGAFSKIYDSERKEKHE